MAPSTPPRRARRATAPLFVVHNHHVADCGAPPALSGDDEQLYTSYFENDYGEQAIFTYNRQTKKGRLYMGDAGWERAYPVKYGYPEGLVVSKPEAFWLIASWAAATMANPWDVLTQYKNAAARAAKAVAHDLGRDEPTGSWNIFPHDRFRASLRVPADATFPWRELVELVYMTAHDGGAPRSFAVAQDYLIAAAAGSNADTSALDLMCQAAWMLHWIGDVSYTDLAEWLSAGNSVYIPEHELQNHRSRNRAPRFPYRRAASSADLLTAVVETIRARFSDVEDAQRWIALHVVPSILARDIAGLRAALVAEGVTLQERDAITTWTNFYRKRIASVPASHRVPLRDLPVWDRIAPAIGEVAEAVILGATLRDPATRPLPEHDGPRLFGYDPADRLGQLVLPEMLREHLLHLRWIFGFSYATLSAAFGVPVDVVQAWEKGEAMPEPAQYGLLGEAADVLGLVAKGAFLSRNTLQRFLARYDVDRLAHDGLLFRVIVREITPRASDPYTRNSWYSGTAAQREERQMFAERHRAVQTFLDAADGDHATAHTTIAKVVTQSQRVLQQAVVEAIEELGVDSSDLADVVTVPDPEYADVDLVVRAPQGTWEALAEREDELQEAVQRRVDASGRHVLAAFLTIGAARVRVTV